MKRLLMLVIVASAAASAWVLPTSAHDHYAQPAAGAGPHDQRGQVLANSQNHPRFVGATSCESNGPIPGDSVGPAWYGLETAHHGPDSGEPGRADRCYTTASGLSPLNPASDRNPAIGP